MAVRAQRRAEFARLRDTPAFTRDGAKITLLMNAGLAVDMDILHETGAEGIGLFRTEFQFMVAEELPRLTAQTQLYSHVLDAADGLPVTFRTLDLGGDKVLPYLEAEREELLEIIASLRRQLEGVQSQLQVSPRKRSSSYMLIDVACGRYDG